MTELLAIAPGSEPESTTLQQPPPGGALASGIVAAVVATLRGETGEILARYRQLRRAQGADSTTDGTTELLLSIDRSGGAAGWSVALGTTSEVVETVWLATLRLAATGVTDPRELALAVHDEERADRVATAWLSVPGLGDRSWSDLLAFVGTSPERVRS